MSDSTNISQLGAAVKALFEQQTIEACIGWKTDPGTNEVHPAVITSASDCGDLVFNGRCVDNLTTYLSTVAGRYKATGIVVKGCDGRALNTLISENRFQKDRIHAIAVSCSGVKIDGVTAEKCADCATHCSPIADTIVGETIKPEPPKFSALETLENMSYEQRWEYWKPRFESCIRCYACRQICPLCYCETCVTDQTSPQWIEASKKLSSNTMWHLARAGHLAGRCADCGECERVCPQGIPLRQLNLSLEKAAINFFKTRPGTVPGETPPLITLSEGDPDDIMGERYE